MSVLPIPFIDLFCGAGGLSVGFEMAGFHAVFANDIDAAACETYALNHPRAIVAQGDVTKLSADQILNDTGVTSIPLVLGGPNCQGVSLRGKRDPNDPKNLMFYHYKRLIEELQPDWFVMENVPGLLHRHNRELITDIFKEFHSIGYECGGEVLLAADYGVPQLRYRFVLIGNRLNKPVLFPKPTHQWETEYQIRQNGMFEAAHPDPGVSRPPWLTVFDAISDLPSIPNGGGSESAPYPLLDNRLTEFQVWARANSEYLFNHVCHKTPAHNIELIQHIPQGKNWKSIPPELRPERFQRVALKDHTTTFGRLSWDAPARTITTYFNNISAGQFVHPDDHRGISVREGARIQSFPDTFRFTGSLARQYRQVGNAVPPLLAYHVANTIRSHFDTSEAPEISGREAAVVYDARWDRLVFQRPIQGMRFNLDKHLVRS